jgi:hypothetical protein
MAKLLTEFVSLDELEILKEDIEGMPGEKAFKIKGPFLQADVKNKNGRTYPRPLVEREVNTYVMDKVSKKRALGELDHAYTPYVNLHRASHLIESLVMNDKGTVMGCAKLIDTPMGKIAKTLVSEGVVLGVSSRSVGTLGKDEDSKAGKMVENFKLITVDIVADPSTPGAFVECVMENKEYIIDGDRIVEMAIDKLEDNLNNKYKNSKQLLSFMNEFLNDMGKRL